MKTVFRVLLLMIAASIATPAQAQVVRVTRPYGCTLNMCKQVIGTGVIVGRRRVANNQIRYNVVSAYHLTGLNPNQMIRQNVDLNMRITCEIGTYPATVVNYNPRMYLMLLAFEVPNTLKEIPILEVNDQMQPAGLSVEIYGHAASRQGAFGKRSVVLRSFGPDVFEITAAFEQGESGGPIIADGYILGICEGYDAKGFGFGPSGPAICRFLGSSGLSASASTGGNASSNNAARTGGGEHVYRPPVLSTRVPVSRLPMQEPVSVPPPPIPDEIRDNGPGRSNSVWTKSQVVPAPLPNPIPSTEKVETGNGKPAADEVKSPPPAMKSPATGSVELSPSSQAEPVVSPSAIEKKSTTVEEPKEPAKMRIWDILMGAGLLAGTGGLGAAALWAVRGVKAVSAAKGIIASHRARHTPQQPSAMPVPNPVVMPVQPAPVSTVTVIPTETPPLPQQVYETSHFVPYAVNDHKEAYEWAKAQWIRKYPQIVESFEGLDSLINQYLSGKGKK